MDLANLGARSFLPKQPTPPGDSAARPVAVSLVATGIVFPKWSPGDLSHWAAAQKGRDEAENSERTWSPEYLKRMHDTPQKGILGAIPLVVLTRAEGGYSNKLDLPAEQLEADRVRQQKELVELSTNGSQKVLACRHNMHLECPGDVVARNR